MSWRCVRWQSMLRRFGRGRRRRRRAVVTSSSGRPKPPPLASSSASDLPRLGGLAAGAASASSPRPCGRDAALLHGARSALPALADEGDLVEARDRPSGPPREPVYASRAIRAALMWSGWP